MSKHCHGFDFLRILIELFSLVQCSFNPDVITVFEVRCLRQIYVFHIAGCELSEEGCDSLWESIWCGSSRYNHRLCKKIMPLGGSKQFLAVRFWWVIVTTLYPLVLQSWYQKLPNHWWTHCYHLWQNTLP